MGHFTALRDAAEHGPPSRALADALAGRAAMLRSMGQIAEGAAEARRAVALGRELGYPAAETQGLGELGLAALEDGDLDSAVQLTRQAEQIGGEMPGTVARVQPRLGSDTDRGRGPGRCRAHLRGGAGCVPGGGDQWHQLSLLKDMAILDLQGGRTRRRRTPP